MKIKILFTALLLLFFVQAFAQKKGGVFLC